MQFFSSPEQREGSVRILDKKKSSPYPLLFKARKKTAFCDRLINGGSRKAHAPPLFSSVEG